jgi:hypothetical protein
LCALLVQKISSDCASPVLVLLIIQVGVVTCHPWIRVKVGQSHDDYRVSWLFNLYVPTKKCDWRFRFVAPTLNNINFSGIYFS